MDVNVISASLQQLDFKHLQSNNRIAWQLAGLSRHHMELHIFRENTTGKIT
jgi:hypothetical protein